jgi:methylated-DNA-[protein]-cysteine S-methyltransferase
MIAEEEHPMLSAARLQIEEYLAGERIEFDLKFDLRGTEFQQEVWLGLASIPLGETSTYGEQAMRIGRPKAVRAVGAAVGRNPISIILPCHRVIGASGDLTGFAGGIETKRSMLAFERADVG